MRGINCKVLWIKALYKCSPFRFQCYMLGMEKVKSFINWLGEKKKNIGDPVLFFPHVINFQTCVYVL
uniref:Uncharacterized protein n=1 Tax=Anguilla anguilla TaxID=7936 RepID=A0A0E9XZ17_ANGAN